MVVGVPQVILAAFAVVTAAAKTAKSKVVFMFVGSIF
jgi:hypothetical protein